MNNEQQADQELNQDQQQTKEERIDELDVIGGGLLKIVQNGFLKIKSMIFPHRTE